MGRAEILENKGEGRYRVQYKFGTEAITRELAKIDADIVELNKGIIKLTDDITNLTTEFDGANTQLQAVLAEPNHTTEDWKKRFLEKLKALNVIGIKLKEAEASLALSKVRKDAAIDRSFQFSALPEAEEREMWMADYSIEIEPTGTDIPTIEIAGEAHGENWALLYPAKNEAPIPFDEATHGERNHALVISPSACFAAWSMFPGWQKYRPGFRVGKITKLVDGEYAKVELQVPLISSEQNLPIPPSDPLAVDVIFERQTHERVPFRYMDCDSIAFSKGDAVLIEYEGHDSKKPIIIGFAHNPQPCAQLNVFTRNKERLRCTTKQPGAWHSSKLDDPPKFGSCYWVGDDGAVSWHGWRARYFAARLDFGTIKTDDYFTSTSLYHRGQDYGPLPGIVLGGCVRKKYLFAVCRVDTDEVMYSCPQIGAREWKEVGRVDGSKWITLTPYYFSASGLKAASAKYIGGDGLTPGTDTQLVELRRNGDAKTPPFAAAFLVSPKIPATIVYPPLMPGASAGEGGITTEHQFAVDYIGETLVTLERRSESVIGHYFAGGFFIKSIQTRKIVITCAALNLTLAHYDADDITTFDPARFSQVQKTTQNIDHLNITGGQGHVVHVTRRIDGTLTAVAVGDGSTTTITATQTMTVTSGPKEVRLLPMTGTDSYTYSPSAPPLPPAFALLASLFLPYNSIYPLAYTVCDGYGHVVTSMPLSSEARAIPGLPEESRLRLFGGVAIGAG